MKMFFLLLSVCIESLLFGCKQQEDSSPEIISVDPAVIGLDAQWQIGASKSNSYMPDQFQYLAHADQRTSIVMCHPSETVSGYYPYIGRNMDVVSHVDPTAHWAARAGQIVMEGSNTGQYSMLRYTVPATGMYSIKASFEGIHFGLSSTDVHVMHNSQALFDALIEGYGGDPAYHVVTGANPAAFFKDTVQLNKGDVIIFAVGYGANKTHYNDTTGLLFSIDPV